MSSLTCTYKVPIVDARLARLMHERGFSRAAKRGTKSLTRPSDAVRHEARPVDTPRFVASHPRCRVFYLPRIQLSRGSCSNDRRRFRFIFRRRVLDLVNDHARRSSRFLASSHRPANNPATTPRCERVLRKKDPESARTTTGRGETSERILRFNLCAA